MSLHHNAVAFSSAHPTYFSAHSSSSSAQSSFPTVRSSSSSFSSISPFSSTSSTSSTSSISFTSSTSSTPSTSSTSSTHPSAKSLSALIFNYRWQCECTHLSFPNSLQELPAEHAMGVYKVIGERMYGLFNPRSMCEYWDADGTFHQRSRVGFLPIIWIHGQARPTMLTWDNLLGIELSAAASHAPQRFALTPSGVIVSMLDATTIRHVLSEEKQRLGPVSQIKFRAIAFPEQTTWPLLWTCGVWNLDRNELQVDRLTSNDTDNLFRSLLSTHNSPTREWFLEEQEESKDRAGKRKRAVLEGAEETSTDAPMACERAHKRQRRSEGCLEGIFDFVPTTP